MSPRDLQRSLTLYFRDSYQHAYPEGRFISIRFRANEYTSSITRYLDLIRLLSTLFNVRVLRNEHSILEGLYIVGRDRIAHEFEQVLIKIIRYAELKTFDYSMSRDKITKIHGHEKISKYKGNIILKFEDIIRRIQKDYDIYAPIRHVLEHEKADQVSFISYMKAFPHLKTKTPLRGIN